MTRRTAEKRRGREPWPTAHDTHGRRAELRRLLTHWRTRIMREAIGLPNASRSGAAGLRSTDVAELAGVSARWYEALERGSVDRRFSSSFLARVVAVLQLDESERAAFYRLAVPEVAATVEYFERLAFLWGSNTSKDSH